ncbi:MAG: DUF1571 domain-containing protein [Planctomycetes bacterium]|nr:DUF1571 domain-containing protein [Planctomycetota bacterium]
MLGKRKVLRLLVGLSLGLAFFGCVGLPRRRPPLDAPAQEQQVCKRRWRRHAVQPPVTQVPADPIPVEPLPVPPATSITTPTTTSPAPPDPLSRVPRPTGATAPPVTSPSPIAARGTPPSDPPPPLTPGLEPPPPPPTAPPSSAPQPDLPRSTPRTKVPVTPARTEVPTQPTPITPAVTNGPFAALRQLHQASTRQYARIDAYIVRLTRREFVKGKLQPEEVLLFKFRKAPLSVYLKWVGQAGRGREVVYVKGQHENKLHTLLAAGDMPFAPAGKRIALSPDSVFVRGASRHSITEAGIGTLIDHFGTLIDALERGDTRQGTLTYLGLQKRPEFIAPVEGVEWKLPPGAEEGLPRGGKRWCFVDPENHLPVLIITHDDRGQEVEYYRYDRFQYPVPLDDTDFDPDKLWGAARDQR